MDIRRFALWHRSSDLPPSLAPALEEAGFARLWLGSATGDLAAAEAALRTTTALRVASGIVNVWRDDAATVAASFHRLEERYPGRFLLGIGTGHPEATAGWGKPYETLSRYLDVLDEQGVPRRRRVLAALGPRVLALARDRSAGAHPYLVTPEHTRRARAIVGDGPLLAPEHKAVLVADPGARGRSAGPRCVRRTSGSSTTAPTCVGWASRTTTWRTAAATGWWTRWWRTARPTPWPTALPRTSTPGPTRSRCSCWPRARTTTCARSW